MSYEALARWYDGFTRDVPYAAFADYYEALLRRDGKERVTLLDLCCGTGNLTLPLAARGYELIGVDASPEMLAIAAQKAEAEKDTFAVQPMFLCQEAAELDLYGTVEGAVCALDGINYLPPRELTELFRRLHLFLEPGGAFVFDVHSVAHLWELDGGAFVDETEDALCLWRGEFDREKNALVYGMDIFSRADGTLWRRESEEHIEYAHSPETLTVQLMQCGFTDVEFYMNGPQSDMGRLFGRAVNLPQEPAPSV